MIYTNDEAGAPEAAGGTGHDEHSPALAAENRPTQPSSASCAAEKAMERPGGEPPHREARPEIIAPAPLQRPMSTAETRLAMWRNGYAPLPCHGKAPVLKEWQKHLETNEDEILLWDRMYPYAFNTGYICGNAPTLDVDISDTGAARAIFIRMRALLGAAMLCRIGNAPKFAIPYRADVPFKGIDIRLIPPGGLPEDGKRKLPGVEFRCDKQQVVAFGRHPEVARDYQWHPADRTPVTVPRADLPRIDEAGARVLVEDLIEQLVGDHGFTRATPPRPPIEMVTRRTFSNGNPRFARERVLGLIRAVALAGEGTRNGLLFWAANRLRDMRDAGELAGEEVRDALDALHEAATRAGLAPREIGRTLHSAMRAPA